MKSNNMKRGTNNFVIQITPNCSIFPHVLHLISDVPAMPTEPIHWTIALSDGIITCPPTHLVSLFGEIPLWLQFPEATSRGHSTEALPIPAWRPDGTGFCQQGQHDCHHGHHGLYESLNWFWIDMLKTDGSPSQVTGGLIDQWASG